MFKEGSQFLRRALRLVKSALSAKVLSQHPARQRRRRKPAYAACGYANEAGTPPEEATRYELGIQLMKAGVGVAKLARLGKIVAKSAGAIPNQLASAAPY